MVRYTLAVKGVPGDAAAAAGMEVEEQGVDLSNGARLAEKDLVEVNPKGQVGNSLFYKSLDRSPSSGWRARK
jgi:hypothetical protein